MSTKASEVKKFQAPALVAQESVTPQSLLQLAVSKGADLDQLQKLMDLQERYEANEARKAFTAAMTAFKADPPQILKNKAVNYGNTHYKHATLDEVTGKIAAGLAKYGLSHRWDVAQAEKGITVTCTLTHVLGHSESVAMTSGADTSGQKNAIQAIGSAVSYLQRYTLLAATGLSTSDQVDDDGKAAGEKAPDAAPEGFAEWWRDLEASAAKGSAALQATWTKPAKSFRAYAAKHKATSWGILKSDAAQVTP